ncbi:hypothetical protein C8R43DRAFT_944081 [Mycena crocata]|nr:hypothetical protein C8R43DRAFT_944081 [Mycena crocata]
MSSSPTPSNIVASDDITSYLGSELGRLTELEGQMETFQYDVEEILRYQTKMEQDAEDWREAVLRKHTKIEEELALLREGMQRVLAYMLWRERHIVEAGAAARARQEARRQNRRRNAAGEGL